MIPVPSSVKSFTRMTLVAAALGAAALSAAPTQAQQGTGLGFSLGLDNGVTLSFQANDRNRPVAPDTRRPNPPQTVPQPQHPGGAGWNRGPGGGQWGHQPGYRQACLSDRDIHRQLRNHGYDNIRLGRETRGRLEATAERRGWVHSMEIDRCAGWVSRVQELYPVGRGPRPGFGLQFHFGN